jgi:hypothetical protein
MSLLDTPVHDGHVAMMAVLQAGEVRLCETFELLLAVERIESLSRLIRPVGPRRFEYISPEEPHWRQDGRRFIFQGAAVSFARPPDGTAGLLGGCRIASEPEAGAISTGLLP